MAKCARVLMTPVGVGEVCLDFLDSPEQVEAVKNEYHRFDDELTKNNTRVVSGAIRMVACISAESILDPPPPYG